MVTGILPGEANPNDSLRLDHLAAAGLQDLVPPEFLGRLRLCFF